MGWYVILGNLTNEGVGLMARPDPEESGGDEPLNPVALLRTAIEAQSGTVQSIFWALGAYDLVAIAHFETPDDASAVMMAVGFTGAIRTTTLTALPSDDAYTEVMSRAYAISGHLRGGHLRGG